jgi:hypothetical protein
MHTLYLYSAMSDMGLPTFTSQESQTDCVGGWLCSMYTERVRHLP